MKKKQESKQDALKEGADKLIYECFRTPVPKNGRLIYIGCEESGKIKAAYINKGFLTKAGRPRCKLTWLERLVILLRDATTEPDYNHEWWGAEISKPIWVRNLDRRWEKCWLYFPEKGTILTAASIGKRLGYALTLTERKMELAINNPDFLEKWQDDDLEQVKRGNEPSEAEKIRIVLPGYESYLEYAKHTKKEAAHFRVFVTNFVEEQGLKAAYEFRDAYSIGARKAFEMDLENPLSDFNRREETFRILSEYWSHINTFRNRMELCLFLCEKFPSSARIRLKQAMASKKDAGLWRNFTEFVRDVCDELDLKLAVRGRPRKNTGSSEE